MNLLAEDAPTVVDIVGTVADSIAGVGTLGALIIALKVYRRQVDDAHRMQASKVTVNMEYSDYSEGSALNDVDVFVDNASSQPIFGIRTLVVRTHLGDHTEMEDDIDVPMSRLEGGETLTMHVSEGRRDYCILNVALLFSDAAGRRWRRGGNGSLCEIGRIGGFRSAVNSIKFAYRKMLRARANRPSS